MKFLLQRFTGGNISVELERGATVGATVGRNLYWPDGTVVQASDLGGNSAPSSPGAVISNWNLILDIPAPITTLASLPGPGFVFVASPTTYSVVDTTGAIAGSVPQYDGADWVMGTALSNPMTTIGDMIVGGIAGVPTAVPAGAATYVWTSNGPGVAPTWQVAGAGGGSGAIGATFDGGGAALTPGVFTDVFVPFNCTIVGATLLADTTGNLVVSVLADPYASFPPTTDLAPTTPPTISGSDKSQDTTLSGWSTAIAAGDVVRLGVVSCSSITRATLSLEVTKT